MGSELKESSLYPTKRRCEEITSSTEAMRTNLLPPNSLTHADDGTASAGSGQFPLLTTKSLPYWSTRRRDNKCPDVTQPSLSYLKLSGSAPRG